MKDKEASMIWRNWVSLGGSVTGTPAVAGWTTRAATVAVRDQDGQVRLDWRDENGWAPLWQLVDLPGSDAPSLARIGGSLYVFGRGPANNLLVGGAMATVNLGGDLRSSPVVAHWRLDGEAHVFARGADSAIWHLRWSR
jgi:hypothetical protein